MGIGLYELMIIAIVALTIAGIFLLVRFVLFAARGKTIKCPRCSERIKSDAKICHYCRHELSV